MKTALQQFNTLNFYTALRDFFTKLNIPVNYLAEEPVRPAEILANTYKEDHPAFQLLHDVYFLGMVDDAAFEGAASLEPGKIESDYDGILIFGVTLHPRENNLLPTRSQLAEITRAFNREFHYTPVVVVFKYGNYIAFANAERLKYKQEWREGEKAGKVSLLRNIDIETPHSGHMRILLGLVIKTTGPKAIKSFAGLYSYWQEVFNVSLLNKKFYAELFHWYSWAVTEVTFPSEPTIHSLFEETGLSDDKKLTEVIQEHKAKNVIRLLTRFLFVWFIKEKKLIPAELFDREYLEKKLLNDLSPFHNSGPQGDLFQDQTANIQSHYYKAILQNLFFATLNCPIKSETGDKRSRGFSKGHFGVFYLMRYINCFKNKELFLEIVNKTVPFLNGGLFECLDIRGEKEKKEERVYIDGFSDNLPKEHKLIVPDFLFFGQKEEVDLSSVIGIKNKKTKQAAVKGLINIFNSYKFTIAENTPIEQDIALDPELLGKVFENLLASYNPETKTTARKQTGSFYTPREIVNYMVDESLIAYLKNEVDWAITKETEEEQDAKLHELFSFDPTNPFADNLYLQKDIIKALDHCTILDPACGSGAFPMGILQKMVHVLQKLDPENDSWRELQMEKAISETESALHLDDKGAREQKLVEINEAFDRQINDPDYARKLFLIENCIYGVDIQPIAVQISKLRFFISLVVEQKVDPEKDNFGIRPLPNLETKFVAANTLIGIKKPDKQMALGSPKIKQLEQDLKHVRHRIFSAKTPSTKRNMRDEDQALREEIGEALIADGWANKTAKQLAGWDPYDQNASSKFFDMEWMFGAKDGFDVVIGNPPYGAKLEQNLIAQLQDSYELFCKETAILFIEKGRSLLANHGILSYIIPKPLTYASNYKKTRLFLLDGLRILVDCGKAFEQVKLEATVFNYQKSVKNDQYLSVKFENGSFYILDLINKIYVDQFDLYINGISQLEMLIGLKIASYEKFGNLVDNRRGAGLQRYLSNTPSGVKALGGKEIDRYKVKQIKGFVSSETIRSYKNATIKQNAVLCQNIVAHIKNPTDHIKITACILKNDNFVILDTINQLSIAEKLCSNFYLWALLNSDLINWYVYRFIYGKAIRTMHFDNPVSSRIPLAIPTSNIIFQTLYIAITHNEKHRLLFEKIINGLIYETYFPDHMQDKQVDILQFVEKDLAEVIQNEDFDARPDNEKEEIIKELHARWTHPDSEVRNRIKLFAVRSPDILKPILESS